MDGPAQSAAVDWSIIFDLIASEYSYTWEQFTGLTYRLLDSCLEAINRRQHNNMAIRAAIHGVKMDLYKKIKPPSEKDLKRAEDESLKILREKRAHGQRQ